MASGSATGSVTVRGGTDNAYYTYTKDVVAGYEGMDSKSLFCQCQGQGSGSDK